MHSTYAENNFTSYNKLYHVPSDVLRKLPVVATGFLLSSLSASTTLLFAATHQDDHLSGKSGNLGEFGSWQRMSGN